ncbi:MAG: DUF1993 domain-containing protein [Methylobacteriaceae bacterium]|nr:DUF1993 domain-containing protein [Rhodoblastus sp.]MCC0005639.1 DUF1993 domain-containing protein [Methylobacteriaceae bacterium]
MAISLYDVSVAGFLQTLTGVAGFLEKGRVHFAEKPGALEEVVAGRLWPDMFPFSFQVISVVHHSQGAIEGARKGTFSPRAEGPKDYAGLQQLVADARTMLKGVTREDMDALEGKEMFFEFRDVKLPFTVENFLMSFSTPNLQFHATTAYDLLRMRGVPIGKRDFTGPLRMKK